MKAIHWVVLVGLLVVGGLWWSSDSDASVCGTCACEAGCCDSGECSADGCACACK